MKNLINKRILSFVMIFAMVLPLVATVFPLLVSAEESGAAAISPTVRLEWKDGTALDDDGVALPHKCEGANGKSTYILTFKIVASASVKPSRIFWLMPRLKLPFSPYSSELVGS